MTPADAAPESEHGNKVGDEVAVMATVLKRVTKDRVSVSIPGLPHSVIDPATRLTRGQQMELSGDVKRIDGDKVTVSLGTMVTVDLDKAGLVQSRVPPKRRTVRM
ncbi:MULTISPECIES: hypothetical protein [Mesorhizobium]|uniref:hypothetical protein n=1 Tax=Mesorhizobium TaxID=68287 RepID=UPI001FCDCFF4|nr:MULTISPECIES: hypothetical protein [Mesorhizobium]MDF3210207.1 hypothetical protein [Mesorhizobium sp. LMG15046]MDF3231236.1 hypothetical protein [Mesorhizobium sp. DSM 30133]